MTALQFSKKTEIPGALGRTGVLKTPHGDIQTPAFVVVGTRASVKAVPPEAVRAAGGQVVLGNTYHLYLEPGEEIVRRAGGLHAFMNWDGPMVTDSGGFQVFSLGAYGALGSKFAEGDVPAGAHKEGLVSIDEEGVTFRSHIDGSEHRFTPERAMEIQHALGADIMFAFDECTSLAAPYEYQKAAMERTHRWAKRSLDAHFAAGAETRQGLFGIVQGGKYKDLRQESARTIGAMDFAGFGVGASHAREELDTAVRWITELLPEEKPRHFLGVGEIDEIFAGVRDGIDTFDCVAPTRLARTGTLHTKDGRLNIFNAQFKEDFTPLEAECDCAACAHYTRAYLAHLFRTGEMLASTLATIHNIRFMTRMMAEIRAAIDEGRFAECREAFLARYYKK